MLPERIVPRPLVARGLFPVPPPREVVPGGHIQPPGTLRRVLVAPEGAVRLVHGRSFLTTLVLLWSVQYPVQRQYSTVPALYYTVLCILCAVFARTKFVRLYRLCLGCDKQENHLYEL